MPVDPSKRPSYGTLIDDEVWAFIDKTLQSFPENAVEHGVDGQRNFYDSLSRSFSHGYPADVTTNDAVISNGSYDVPVRRYMPTNLSGSTIIMYMHGGGFTLGGLDSHDEICAELCSKTGFKLTAIDYRLLPEHKHPAAFEDCLVCVEHEAAQNRVPLVLCGDSAGGNLAAAVSQRICAQNVGADAIDIAGQVLIYPELGGDTSLGSYLTHAHAPMLTTEDVLYFLKIRTAGEMPTSDISIAPLRADDFSGLPETVAFSAECDPLADDGKHYCDAVKKAGGRATWINEQGLVHGFLRARHSSRRASASFDRMVDAIKVLGSGLGYGH